MGVKIMKKCKSCQSEIDDKATKCPNCQADQRGWFRKHPILTVMLVLFAFIIIGSGSSGNKNVSKNQNNNQSSTQENSKPSPVPMKITAREIADDFDANQVAAEEKWKDKLIEFSGKISNITDTGLSFSNIASKQFSMTQISCRIQDKAQLLPLKNGETVTVRGVVGNQAIGVIGINDCEVVE